MADIEQLAAPLRMILDRELALGNTIQEVGEWPPTCQLLVLLRCTFAQAYPCDAETTYREINDRHYWKAEYDYQGGLQTLACGFGCQGPV